MFLRTDRLFLRPVFPEDWRGVYEGIAHEDVVRNLARAPWPYGEEDAKGFCARANDDARTRFVITVPERRGAVAGMIGFEQLDGAGDELGYWIAPAWQGRGFATEAVRGVVAIARAIGTPRLEAGHFLDNPASGRVLRKAGFVPTGAVETMTSAARGGEQVMCRRFVLPLSEEQSEPRPAAA